MSGLDSTLSDNHLREPRADWHTCELVRLVVCKREHACMQSVLTLPRNSGIGWLSPIILLYLCSQACNPSRHIMYCFFQVEGVFEFALRQPS